MTEVPSPCVNICELDQTGEYCRGCGRSLDEIAGWGGASDDARRTVIGSLPERMARLNSGTKI